MVVESQAIDEGLGNRLDRELVSGVTGFVEKTVGGGEADPEQVRIRLRELGDVGGDSTLPDAGKPGVQRFEERLDG
jgi:hypothetical protein